VVELPRIDLGLRILYTREPVLVRAFIAQFCIESLHEAVLPRLRLKLLALVSAWMMVLSN
jgi:hypothetical protein